MSFDDRGFESRGDAEGVVTIDMMGEVEEMPWTGTLYVDAAGQVGALCDATSGEERWLFVSHGAEKRYLSFPGQRNGGVEVGGVFLTNTADSDRDAVLAAHLAAAGDDLTADADALITSLKAAPQDAVDLSMQLLAALQQAMATE